MNVLVLMKVVREPDVVPSGESEVMYSDNFLAIQKNKSKNL